MQNVHPFLETLPISYGLPPSDLSVFPAACGAAAPIQGTWLGLEEFGSPAGFLSGEVFQPAQPPSLELGAGRVAGLSLESASEPRGPSAAGLRAGESLRQV